MDGVIIVSGVPGSGKSTIAPLLASRFLDDLETRPVYFVLLLPDLETLRRRNARRSKADVFHQSAQLDPVARRETREVGLRIDTSRLSPAESVDAILAGLETEARIPGT